MSSIKYLLVMLFSIAVVACGGGGSTPPPPATSFTIGGTITGLTGTVTLQNNGADSLSRTTSATYTFATAVASGAAYSVTISAQPAGQTCSVANSTGSATANVTNVNITCVTNTIGTFTIGGSISGLTGTVVLQNNGAGNLSRNANGQYNFPTSTTAYAVTVLTQPVGQVCTVANATGTAAAAVTNVNVTCVTNTYTIGGSISGLTGTVVLQNNAANDLSRTTNAAYSFTTQIAHGANYAVTVLSQPVGQTCTVANGSGTATGAVNNVNVTCVANTYTIGGTISGLTGTVVLQNNATNDLSRTTNGAFTFTTPITHGGTYAVTVLTQPAGLTCSMGNGSGTATANVTNIAVTCAAAPTYTISGTITGSYGAGVTITRSGTGTTTAVSAADGTYSFPGLLAGSYTLTPALVGYTYAPAAPLVVVSANTTQDFVATSAITSYSVSGTLTNNSTAAGGGTIRVFNNGCTSYNNCQIVAAAHFGSLAVGASTTYTIRGLQPGNYQVKAGIGVVGSGWPNASNPTSVLTAFTIGSANVSGVSVSMADVTAPTPATPTGLTVSPGNTAAFIQYNPPTNASGAEKATSYNIYYGTDTAATNGAGSPVNFPSQGLNQSMYFMKGLTSGTYYFKMTALVGSTESAPTGIVSANIGGSPAAGTYTVTGTVTCNACPALSASTPMMVGVYDQTNGIPYFTNIASPTSSQAYTITGVPSGTNYFPFAVIDMNNNGHIDVGDISNTNGNGTSIAVTGNVTNNTIALTGASATVDVSTSFWSSNGTTGSYNANVSLNDGTKRLVGATLFSGPKVPVPSDLSTYGNNWANVQITGTPSVGDSYQFLLTFSDGSTQNMTASVTGVLGASNLAQSLAIVTNGTGGSSTTVPLFTWAAPATPPASFTYRVNLYGSNNSTNWNYPKDAGLPSTTSPLQVLYNVDGKASGPLVSGTGQTYNWQVDVRDANRNSATMQAPTYAP